MRGTTGRPAPGCRTTSSRPAAPSRMDRRELPRVIARLEHCDHLLAWHHPPSRARHGSQDWGAGFNPWRSPSAGEPTVIAVPTGPPALAGLAIGVPTGVGIEPAQSRLFEKSPDPDDDDAAALTRKARAGGAFFATLVAECTA